MYSINKVIPPRKYERLRFITAMHK